MGGSIRNKGGAPAPGAPPPPIPTPLEHAEQASSSGVFEGEQAC